MCFLAVTLPLGRFDFEYPSSFMPAWLSKRFRVRHECTIGVKSVVSIEHVEISRKTEVEMHRSSSHIRLVNPFEQLRFCPLRNRLRTSCISGVDAELHQILEVCHEKLNTPRECAGPEPEYL